METYLARIPGLVKRGATEWNGPCPLCGGQDRFHVKADSDGVGVFGCRQCIDGDLDPTGENVKAVFRLLDGRGRSPAPSSRSHTCTLYCGTYDRVDGQGTITNHRRNDGASGGAPYWRIPKGTTPPTHVNLYGTGDGPVVLAEGEKAARAIQAAGLRAAAWLGGTGGVGLVHFSRLADEKVVLWPDADNPGLKAMAAAGRKLNGIVAELLTVDTSDMPGVVDGAYPDSDGTDAADLEAELILARVDLAEPWEPPLLEEVEPRTEPTGDLTTEPSVGTGVTFNPDHEGLWAALAYLGLDLRKNSRNLAIEIARKDWGSSAAADWYRVFGFTPPADGWVELTDDLAARLITFIATNFKKPTGGRLYYSDRDFRLALASLSASRGVNPVREWLLALPDWDGQERLSTVLVEALDVDDNVLNRATGRAFFIGAVARALKPGCKNELWPLLFSRGQGLGKSTFCRAILPPDRQIDWFSDSLDLNENTQKRREQVGDAWIVEYSELQGLSGRRTEAVKSWIGQQDDRYRPPWYKVPVKLLRSFVVIATGNDVGSGLLPADSSGTRRFVAVKVPDTTRPSRVLRYLEESREQLWAEAKAAYLSGEQWWFPEDIERQQAENNAPWLRENEAVSGKVYDLTERSLGGDPRPIDELMVTASVVKEVVDASKERSLQLEFAEALRLNGWQRKSVRNPEGKQRRLWQPPAKPDLFYPDAQTNTAESTEEEVCAAPLPEAGATCGQHLEDGRCPVADTHACTRCGLQRADCRCDYEGVGGPEEARALNAEVKQGRIDPIEAYRQHTELTAPGLYVDEMLQVVERWRSLRDNGSADEIAMTIARMDATLKAWQGDRDDPIMALIAGVRNDLESARVRALRREGLTAPLPGLGEVR